MRLYRGVRTNRLWRWVAASVVVGLAVLGYVFWIPVRHPSPRRVAALAVTAPVDGLRAHPHASESDASAGSLAAVKGAAAATPGETAVYTVAWKGTTSKSAGALVVLALPSAADTRATRAEVRTAYLGRTSLTAEGYGYAGALRLSAVPGAAGATFTAGTTPTITATTRRTDAEVFSVGRVVVVATAQGEGSHAKSIVDALAVEEYTHLRRTGARPMLAVTSLPVVASLVYAAVAVAVLAVVELGPWSLAAARRRREAAWEAAVRRERATRGSKVVKRQAGRTPVGRSGSKRPAGSGRTRR
jgi:hypothetical protein